MGPRADRAVSAAGDVSGIVSTGDFAMNVQARHLAVSVGPVVQSSYVEQVRRIAPPELDGRDTELAELEAFCTEPGQGPYAWWQAGPWAGKTALMSWFVLHPPEKSRVISFFVTSRYAGQSDRVAFTDVVMEQLAELLGRPPPPYLTEATRDAHLLRGCFPMPLISACGGTSALCWLWMAWTRTGE